MIELVLCYIANELGDSLFKRVPKLWSLITSGCLQSVDEEKSILHSLFLLKIIVKNLHPNLYSMIEELYPQMFHFLKSENDKVVQFTCNAATAICKKMTPSGIPSHSPFISSVMTYFLKHLTAVLTESKSKAHRRGVSLLLHSENDFYFLLL